MLGSPGPGNTVTSAGAHDPSTFAPDPANAADALVAPGGQAAPGGQIEPYERTWSAAAGANRVDDLLVRFPTTGAATAFLVAVRHSLDSGEIVSGGPLATVPGARSATYFSSAPEAGIGQAVTMRVGPYVDVLAFFSAGTDNPGPITSGAAARVAEAQYAALRAAQGGVAFTPAAKRGRSANGSNGASGVIWAVVAVVVLASTLAVPLVLRRRTRAGSGHGLGSEQY
jgi:hypothetical protein